MVTSHPDILPLSYPILVGQVPDRIEEKTHNRMGGWELRAPAYVKKHITLCNFFLCACVYISSFYPVMYLTYKYN